jgi:hypothetical protein
MIEIGSTAATCCITDTGQGRIWWEWREGHWVRSESRSSGPATTCGHPGEVRHQRKPEPDAR